jgi:hypothetical protein
VAQTASKELDIVGQRFSCLTSVTSSAQLQVSDDAGVWGALCKLQGSHKAGASKDCTDFVRHGSYGKQSEQINISFHQKPSEVNQKLKIPTSEIFGCNIFENDIPSPWCQMPGRETGPRAG